jgi:hypothetical protein
VGSDSYPGTVSWVSPNGNRIRVRRCDYKMVRGDPFSEHQEHAFFDDNAEDDEDSGTLYSWRERRKGYVALGTRSSSTAAQTLGLGFRSAYRDPHF